MSHQKKSQESNRIVYRKGFKIEELSTLSDISRTSGYDKSSRGKLKYKYAQFPDPVAKIGKYILYSIKEVNSFHKQVVLGSSIMATKKLYGQDIVDELNMEEA